jgi:uncharacterized protein YbaA (DUF1428 family)
MYFQTVAIPVKAADTANFVKATRDRGKAAMMLDQRMRETPPGWNGQRAIFGGFSPVHDTAQA